MEPNIPVKGKLSSLHFLEAELFMCLSFRLFLVYPPTTYMQSLIVLQPLLHFTLISWESWPIHKSQLTLIFKTPKYTSPGLAKSLYQTCPCGCLSQWFSSSAVSESAGELIKKTEAQVNWRTWTLESFSGASSDSDNHTPKCDKCCSKERATLGPLTQTSTSAHQNTAHHFLLQVSNSRLAFRSEVFVAQWCLTLQPHGL